MVPSFTQSHGSFGRNGVYALQSFGGHGRPFTFPQAATPHKWARFDESVSRNGLADGPMWGTMAASPAPEESHCIVDGAADALQTCLLQFARSSCSGSRLDCALAHRVRSAAADGQIVAAAHVSSPAPVTERERRLLQAGAARLESASWHLCADAPRSALASNPSVVRPAQARTRVWMLNTFGSWTTVAAKVCNECQVSRSGRAAFCKCEIATLRCNADSKLHGHAACTLPVDCLFSSTWFSSGVATPGCGIDSDTLSVTVVTISDAAAGAASTLAAVESDGAKSQRLWIADLEPSLVGAREGLINGWWVAVSLASFRLHFSAACRPADGLITVLARSIAAPPATPATAPNGGHSWRVRAACQQLLGQTLHTQDSPDAAAAPRHCAIQRATSALVSPLATPSGPPSAAVVPGAATGAGCTGSSAQGNTCDEDWSPETPAGRRLLRFTPRAQLPRHVAIVMDGNGRWAESRGLPRSQGHIEGVNTMLRVIRSCRRLGIRYLTLYAFSSQNWKRPALEVQTLMRLLLRFLRSDAQQLVGNGVRLRVLGDITTLPDAAQQQLRSLVSRSRRNTALDLSLALSYGGREEITAAAASACRAVRAGFLDPEDLTPERFRGFLPHPAVPDPDLLIRTSGEMRVSNFLLWQIAYSEMVVLDCLWPDMSEDHLVRAIAAFAGRERRFGKTSAQLQTVQTGSGTTGIDGAAMRASAGEVDGIVGGLTEDEEASIALPAIAALQAAAQRLDALEAPHSFVKPAACRRSSGVDEDDGHHVFPQGDSAAYEALSNLGSSGAPRRRWKPACGARTASAPSVANSTSTSASPPASVSYASSSSSSASSSEAEAVCLPSNTPRHRPCAVGAFGSASLKTLSEVTDHPGCFPLAPAARYSSNGLLRTVLGCLLVVPTAALPAEQHALPTPPLVPQAQPKPIKRPHIAANVVPVEAGDVAIRAPGCDHRMVLAQPLTPALIDETTVVLGALSGATVLQCIAQAASAILAVSESATAALAMRTSLPRGAASRGCSRVLSCCSYSCTVSLGLVVTEKQTNLPLLGWTPANVAALGPVGPILTPVPVLEVTEAQGLPAAWSDAVEAMPEVSRAASSTTNICVRTDCVTALGQPAWRCLQVKPFQPATPPAEGGAVWLFPTTSGRQLAEPLPSPLWGSWQRARRWGARFIVTVQTSRAPSAPLAAVTNTTGLAPAPSAGVCALVERALADAVVWSRLGLQRAV